MAGHGDVRTVDRMAIVDAATPPAPATGYPRQAEADVVLRDGSTVRVRAVRGDDVPDLNAFFAALSTKSVALRFFTAGVSDSCAARRAADVDFATSYALVALSGRPARIVGHAMYAACDAGTVEVAFVLADEMQGRGLGTVLLAHIAEAAAAAGFETMRAEVLPENRRMLEVLRESGFPFELQAMPGTVRATSPVSLSPEAFARFEQRDHHAAVAAVGHILAPQSVALVGAARTRHSVGGAIFHNLIEGSFGGTVYAVNNHADSVQGIQAYPSLSSLPVVPELVVIAVPARTVLDVARECGAIGVPGLVVVSAGFAETGPRGRRRQDELVRICRDNGMRLLGPNCLGVIATADDLRMNATFSRRMPPPGPLALASQSGALGLAAIDRAGSRGLGLASFVSVGNGADITPNDLLDYWEDSDQVGVIALYLESITNPRAFARVARRVARSKAVVAVKSGRSAAGSSAISSHTGSALAASDLTVDALFRQSGVTRAETVADLLDVAALLGTQPLPRGKRVAVLTNSGGPGILCADALAAEGLELADLSSRLRERLGALFRAGASTANPIDMLATARSSEYRRAMRTIADDDSVDALIAIYTPTGLDDPAEMLRGVAAGVDAVRGRIPVLLVALTRDAKRGLMEGRHGSAPVYPFPEDAARALGHAVRRREWLDAPRGSIRSFEDTRPDEAAATIANALGSGPGWLSSAAVGDVLRAYGLPLVESRIARSAAEAATAARELGAPVALKADAPGLVHKTEVAAVALNLQTPADVEREAERMTARLRASGYGVDGLVVQRMAHPGVELLVGVANDASFGPVLVCGEGGVTAELTHDLGARITPVTDVDAQRLVEDLRIAPLLHGWRGGAAVDVAALEETILRVSALVEAHPEVVELDLNPVVVSTSGACVVDARIRVDVAAPDPAWPALGSAGPPR